MNSAFNCSRYIKHQSNASPILPEVDIYALLEKEFQEKNPPNPKPVHSKKRETKKQVRERLGDSSNPGDPAELEKLGKSSTCDLLKHLLGNAADQIRQEQQEGIGCINKYSSQLFKTFDLDNFAHLMNAANSSKTNITAIKQDTTIPQRVGPNSMWSKLSLKIYDLELPQTILFSPVQNMCMGPIIEQRYGFVPESILNWTTIDVKLSKDQRWKLAHRHCKTSKWSSAAASKTQTQAVQIKTGQLNSLQRDEEYPTLISGQLRNQIKRELLRLCSDDNALAKGCCEKIMNDIYKSQHDMASHALLDHLQCDYREYTFAIIETIAELRAFNEEHAGILSSLGKYQQEDSANQGEPIEDFAPEVPLLILKQRSEVRVMLDYSICTLENKRICIVTRYWHARQYYLDMGVALMQLNLMLKLKRVPEIVLNSCLNEAWYFYRLGFFKVFESKIITRIKNLKFGNSTGEWMSRKSLKYLADTVPITKSPAALLTSERGDQVRRVIKILNEKQIPQILEQYKKFQHVSSASVSNTAAKVKDQAITPQEVFDSIAQKMKVHKEQMFDVCKFQPNWDAKTHQNALKEEWVGNFIFCNPPFSIAAWFITEMFIQYFKGKNVVAILPQESTESSYGQQLLRMIGSVHKLGNISFENYNSNLPTPVSLIFLLQPEHIDFLKGRRKDCNYKEGLKIIQCNESILRFRNDEIERQEFALRLISLGFKGRKIQKLIHQNSNYLSKLTKEHLKEFMEMHKMRNESRD